MYPKTALCLFHKRDSTPVVLNINGSFVISQKSMNVLGVIFDSKLNWVEHISTSLFKANRALNAVKLIRRYFTCKELLTIVTANVFSVMYYNSEIWHVPCLKGNLKQKLLSASAKTICVYMKYCNRNLSFEAIHSSNNRATPNKMLIYKHALLLFKLYNNGEETTEWQNLNANQTVVGI